jgi:NAD dependent epimerase/dehydratase family enzyme
VLSANGSALKLLLPLFKLGLGSAIGSGKQYMPWIHIDDLVSVFCEALFNPNFKGTYNAVASEHVTNKQFSTQLAKSLSRPFFAPNVSSFLLNLLFGEMSNMLLQGSRVSNQKLLDTGFTLKYPSLSSALNNIAGK